MDLDHFKDVNDHHGHIAGDLVLSAVADALRAEVRDHDLVGRFGGEEFVVLLAGVEVAADDGVLAIADRIRAHIASLRVEIPTPDGPLTVEGLTVSIGAAVHPGHGEDVGTLMQAADAALYAAKRAGRNTVRLAASPPTDALAPDSPS
jgi:diguanylate cyclase (GGDEF)-like protein